MITASFTVDSRNKHGMIKGVKPWTIKVVFNKDTRRVIGSQIVSMSEAPTKEIDVMNMAIKMGYYQVWTSCSGRDSG
jgi:NADH oxidase (H2O2-forming)